MKRLWLSSLLVFGLFVATSTGYSAPLCEALFSGDAHLAWKLDPKTALNALLDTDKPSRKTRRSIKRIEKMKLDKPVSENQLRLLVRHLFELRHGEMNNYRMLLKTNPEIFDAQLTRVLGEEAAVKGLRSFYESRGLVLPKDTWLTKIKKIIADPETERLGSVLSFMSLTTRVPLLNLPTIRTLKLTPAQVETLLLEGRDSASGQEIVRKLMPEGIKDMRFNLFARAFNRSALIFAIYMLIEAQDEALEDEAQENGMAVLKGVEEKIKKIENRFVNEQVTREDIEYDEVAKVLEKKNGKLTVRDLVILCGEINAPNRCR